MSFPRVNSMLQSHEDERTMECSQTIPGEGRMQPLPQHVRADGANQETEHVQLHSRERSKRNYALAGRYPHVHC